MAENTLKTIPGRGLGQMKVNDDLDKFMTGRIQPQAIPLEEAVLGAILIDTDAMPSVIEILRRETFYLKAHQTIFEVMSDLFGKQMPIDLLTVSESLKKSGKIEEIGGVGYLVNLSNKVGSAANIEFHARIITQKYIQRELIRVSTDVIRNSFEDSLDVLEILDEAEKGLYNITDQNLHTGYESLSSLVVQAQKEIESISEKGSELTGVSSGFKALDKLTNGWQPSDLIIVAARPGMGKTAFTLSMAKNAAEAGNAVAVFSLEMASLQLTQRLISGEAEIASGKLKSGKMDEDEWKRLHSGVDRLSQLPMYIDDTPAINIFELRAKCRRLKQNHDIKMIIIDYLQLMTSAPNEKRGNREQEISSISRALKALAKELSVPVIALSQLSRSVETRGGEKRPVLSDLRESGAIEQDADIVTFIYRPGYYQLTGGGGDAPEVPSDQAEIIIAKHRNGGLDTVLLKFRGEFTKFENLPESGFVGGDDVFGNNKNQYNTMITKQSRINSDNFGFDDPFTSSGPQPSTSPVDDFPADDSNPF
jgi:replicative DNA helicase